MSGERLASVCVSACVAYWIAFLNDYWPTRPSKMSRTIEEKKVVVLN